MSGPGESAGKWSCHACRDRPVPPPPCPCLPCALALLAAAALVTVAEAVLSRHQVATLQTALERHYGQAPRI